MKNITRISRLITLALLAAASNCAFAEAETPHYQGFSRDKSSEGSEFRFYLSGGEFLGRKASFHTIAVAVQQQRKGRLLRRLEGCVYHFDDADRSKDRIECAENKTSPLSGVQYARDQKLADGKGGDEDLVCVRRCGPLVPSRLSLEDADEDNG